MRVLVECFNVIVKRPLIEDPFPGGLHAYAAVLPGVLCAGEAGSAAAAAHHSEGEPTVRLYSARMFPESEDNWSGAVNLLAAPGGGGASAHAPSGA